MVRHTYPPWGDRFGNRPIERYFPRDDPTQGEAAEKDACAELDRRMARLADYYGARTFKELARSLAAEMHPAFTIIDRKPKEEAARKWQGQMGLQLVDLVVDIRAELRRYGGAKRITWKHVLNELCAPSSEATKTTLQFWKKRYGAAMPDFLRMSPETLRANHSIALRFTNRIYGSLDRKKPPE